MIIQLLEKIPIHHIAIFSLTTFIIIIYKRLYTTDTNRLPSPRRLPIIGNLHQLGTIPPRSLQSLSKKHGDMMLLHLGSKPTIVVSSANAAEEIMKTHDMIFANRPVPRAARILFYNATDMGFSKHGEYWKQIKNICILNMLSNKKVQSFRKHREEESGVMIENIRKTTPYTPVNLSAVFAEVETNVMCRVLFGRKYKRDNNEGFVNIKELLNDLSETLGAFLIGDYVPWLSWIDNLSGVLSKATKVAKAMDGIIQKNVEKHMNSHNKKDDENQDFVDDLLEIQRNNPSFQMETIKALLLDMLAAGIETNVTLLEWTMSELLRHPQVMKKLQEEVRQFLGNKTLIDEDDLKEMHYLKAVLKEALRLHPSLPFLLFREPSQDRKVQNHDIAAGTQVIINAWAIQRHPAYWDEPEEFRPERFLGSVEKGKGFEYIPFGAGRRSCPGMSFASVIAELVLANLIGKFNWKCDHVDDNCFMVETFGASMRKRDPLFGTPTPYFRD